MSCISGFLREGVAYVWQTTFLSPGHVIISNQHSGKLCSDCAGKGSVGKGQFSKIIQSKGLYFNKTLCLTSILPAAIIFSNFVLSDPFIGLMTMLVLPNHRTR